MSLETVFKTQDESVLEVLGGYWGRILCLNMVLVSPTYVSSCVQGSQGCAVTVMCPLCQRLISAAVFCL